MQQQPTKHISHIAQMRAQYAYNRKQVLWLTGMSDEELSNHQFEEGLAWLTAYTGGEEEATAALMLEPLIWKWWTNEWNRRDDGQYLSCLYDVAHQPPLAVKSLYLGLHARIYIQYTPPYVLLAHSFKKLKR